jgi:hypothetical protein
MKSSKWGLMNGALRVAVAVLALTGGWTQLASAQQSGEIRGRITSSASGDPLGSVVVIATSPAALGEQFGLAENDGTYVIPLLPPGTYAVRFELDGYHARVAEGIVVELGQARSLTVEMVPTSIEAEPIVVTAEEAPAIDRGSSELGLNINREFYRNVPSGRRYTAILRDTPGTTQDDVGTSVFGSTGVENTYVIEGLNTTGVGFGDAAADLNVDFFEELEVKSGAYMPEFGRSTGGIFNLVLRSGGNEFHGDVFVNATPGFFRASPTPVYRAGEAIGREDEFPLDLDAGFAIGGPIIEDRLWFFAGFNPTLTLTDVSRIYQRRVDRDGDGEPDVDANGNPIVEEVGRDSYERNRITWQSAGKLTLGLDSNNRVSLAYFGNPFSQTGVLRAVDDSRSSNGINGSEDYFLADRTGGSHNFILGYAGQFLEQRLRVESFVGLHRQTDDIDNRVNRPVEELLYEVSLDDLEPGKCDELAATPFVDCPVSSYRDGGTGYFQDETLYRYTGGLRLTNIFSGHTVRYGFETEYKTYSSRRGYSGGWFEDRYGDDPATDPYAFERIYFAREEQDGSVTLFGNDGVDPFRAKVATLTLSGYIQDSWELNRYLTVGGGVRWDYEQIQDTEGDGLITIPDEFAPRMGVSFDPTGDGRSRIFASYGWFFESVPLDINQRSFSAEGIGIRYADENGDFYCFDDVGDPVPGGAPPDCTYDPYGLLGGENSPVVNDLKGQFHDEFALGAEYDVHDGWVIGTAAVARRLRRAIEDISPDDGNNYFIANPGENDCDVPEEFRDPLRDVCSVDRDGDGTFSDDEYDAGRTVFPKPVRLYEGLVFSVRRRLADHFQVLSSYTLSRLVGNYAGLYSPDNEQLDPNISSQYDLVSLTENRYGRLPNDHTHSIKLAGSYELGGVTSALSGLTIGLRYEGRSGTPINYLGRHDFYGRNEVFILPRGSGGTTPWVHQVDLYVGYDIPLAKDVVLNFNATAFNLFNFQQVTRVDQEYTTDVVNPLPAGTDLRTALNADGSPISENPTFGEPRAYQLPLFVRLGARLSF